MLQLILRFHSFRVALVALCIAMATPVFAQMNIEITGVGQSLYPIAVMRFKDENKLPTSVTDIIRQDLARSGYFKNTENGNASESDEGAPNYKSWAARGADALVVGSVVQTGGAQFEIHYKLFDIRKSEGLGGLNLNSSADNLRAVAHKIADDIILKARFDAHYLLNTEAIRLTYFNLVRKAQSLGALEGLLERFRVDCFSNQMAERDE